MLEHAEASWGPFYRGAIQRSRERAEQRRREEADLAQETGWGRLYAEMDGPEARGLTSEYDPSVYDPTRSDPTDWREWEGPDYRFVFHGPHPAPVPEPLREWPAHVHLSTEIYAPGTFFGGAGGWGGGGI